MRVCDIEGCGRKHDCHGLCNTHAERLRRTGDVKAHVRIPKNHDGPGNFFAKVRKTEDCWYWEGAVSSGGYGSFTASGKTWTAHRYSYFLANGQNPEGVPIHHTCHRELCVNPEHLILVTQAVNTIEALAYSVDHARCVRAEDIRSEYKSLRRKEIENAEFRNGFKRYRFSA